ncbi:MAG: SRPBCC domain-containing protein [Alphaproteobacteria bacterium]|nr:SRPBCC domain-containing protein [Alphaproteobacteria bacterium]
MAHAIRTDCVIAAPPAKVWAVLAEFAAWPAWNPLNLAAQGEAKVGARVPMVFRDLPSGKPGAVIRQTVTIVAAEPGRELAWAGHVPIVFKGRHGFLLTAQGEGTHVLHTEALSGLLPATWSAAKIERDFVPAYEAVNRALAARVAALP